MRKLALSIIISMLSSAIFIACHADENDPVGLAGELEDPVRRQNAIHHISRMYTKALADNGGDRENAAVKGFADQVVEKLTACYLGHPEDTQNGLGILNLFMEMRDPRSLPALVKALQWRAEVTEEHAITAASTMQFMTIPDDKKGEVITALDDSVQRVTQARPIDNRIRIQIIRTLGAIGDRRASPTLIKLATTQSEEQNFLINRLAAQMLGELGDPAAVDAMIEGLFLFSPTNPGQKMNDVAGEALVRIGRPALQPLLGVLRGENERANALCDLFIEAVRQRDENAARGMNKRAMTSLEATFALGALGLPEAMEPLIQESQVDNPQRKFNAALALRRLTLSETQIPQVREHLRRVFSELPNDMTGIQMRAQFFAATRHMYDASFLPFYLVQAKDTDLHPAARTEALRSFALLANKDEAQQLTQMIEAEPTSENGGFQENFRTTNEKAIAVATECDADLACYIGKLGDADKDIVVKATYGIGRYGRGNAEAITALVGKLDHMEAEVRLAAVHAIDSIAVAGSQEAIDKIQSLREIEEGRAVWRAFSVEALPIQARLRTRSQGA